MLLHLVAHELTPLPRRVPESRRCWGLGGRISGFLPAPSKPDRLRFSTCAIEVSACIPTGGLPAHASARPQAGASPTWSGIHPPSSVPSIPGPQDLGAGEVGGAPWVTGQPGPALALGHQDARLIPCLLRPLCEEEESSGWARNSGITVACERLCSLPCRPTQRVGAWQP